MNKIYMEQRKKEQYDSQIEFYKMLNEQYLQMEGLRHDMKNHVLALYGLWEKKEFEKAEKYLKKMMENGNIGGSDEVTGNRAVDALLFSKKKKAEELSIRWVTDMQIPKNCTVDEFDLCVLLGNLLDNAIKACTEITDVEYRFVDMQFQQIKKCLLLVIKNGTVLKDVKEIKQGMGIFNINETVRKYDGTVSMKVVNHVFEVSVLIPMIMTDIS
ncbi:MAG: sensor histidine kinase [Eubacterium sp.]|nr:sensor histidine kinase [Eubacterium sp.]